MHVRAYTQVICRPGIGDFQKSIKDGWFELFLNFVQPGRSKLFDCRILWHFPDLVEAKLQIIFHQTMVHVRLKISIVLGADVFKVRKEARHVVRD